VLSGTAVIDLLEPAMDLDAAMDLSMFVAARQLADPARVAGMRKDLPVYVVVGKMDPVNGGMALVDELVHRYEAAGLQDVTLVSYPEARHEVFNETNRDEVVAGVVAWLDRVLPD
jgi:alpha-beta hydrolase superfamily lysophospholipase